MAIYPVQVVNFTSLQQMATLVFINISCMLTGQREAVPVRAVMEKSSLTDHCDDSNVVQQLIESYQIFLFTIFAGVASTAVIFLAYNAFLNRIQTVPVVYVPTSGSAQPGYTYPSTNSQFNNPQPPPAASRLQHWLWSVRH